MIIREYFEPEAAKMLEKLLSPRDQTLITLNLGSEAIAEVFGADACDRRQTLLRTLDELQSALSSASWEIRARQRILNEFNYFKKLIKEGKEADLTRTEEFVCALAAIKASEHPIGALCIEAILQDAKESEQ